MGDIMKWGAEQEAIADARRHREECKKRHENVNPVELNDSINDLLKSLETQQLTKATFNRMRRLAKAWFGEKQ